MNVGDANMRPYQAADFDAVAAILRKVLGSEEARRRLGTWHWLVEGPPMAGAGGVFVLDVGGTVAGLVYLLPTRVRLAANSWPLNWVMLLMVDPDRRGVGYALMRFAVSDAQQRTNFGFPYLRLFRFYLRAGKGRCVALDHAEDCYLPASASPLRGRLPRGLFMLADATLRGLAQAWGRWLGRRRGGPAVAEVGGFSGEFTRLWERAAAHYAPICARDQAFLHWRFVAIPHKRYRILVARDAGADLIGYLVFTINAEDGRRVGCLSDFLVLPGATVAFSALACRAVALLLGDGVDLIKVTLSPAMAWQRRILRRYGFVYRARSNRLIGSCHQPAAIGQGILTLGQWYFTRADSDLDL